MILLICVLLGTRYFTLTEQKWLGVVQERVAPVETRETRLLQPVLDAAKLFKRELFSGFSQSYFLYFLSPFLMIFLTLVIWLVFPSFSGWLSIDNITLYFICCLGFGVYSPMFAGWFSLSKYSCLGSLRVIVQVIS